MLQHVDPHVLPMIAFVLAQVDVDDRLLLSFHPRLNVDDQPLPGVGLGDTCRRVLGALNPAIFQQCFQQWLASLHVLTEEESEGKRHIAIDGKTLRRSHDRKNGCNRSQRTALVFVAEEGIPPR